MVSIRMSTAAAAAWLLASPALAQAQAPAAGSTPPAAAPAMPSAYTPITPSPALNIAAELKASGEFTTLIKALTATNLLGLVQSTPNLTVIAPTDAAFAALPPGQLDALMADPAKLQAVLTYHVIATKVPASRIQGHSAAPITTAAQKPVTFDGSAGDVKINGQKVLQAGIPASNGVIYVVGQVLAPMA